MPLAFLTAIFKMAMISHRIDVLAPFIEAINVVLRDTLTAMSLAEFLEGSKRTGWVAWAIIRTPEAARAAPNTRALGCFAEVEGAVVGTPPLHVRPHALRPRL